MRGGISYIAKRCSKANNKHMTDFDSSEKSKFIACLDAKYLYGWALRQYLFYGRFEQLSQKRIDKFHVNSISGNTSDGYKLEYKIYVSDLKFHDDLHYLHNDYPLAPQKLEISNDTLSIYYSNFADKYKIKVDGDKKLLPNLGNKCKYAIQEPSVVCITWNEIIS